MIPVNRPVIGYDLEDLREKLGISSADAAWLFGMSITKWMLTARKSADKPVKPSLALFVRLLDRHPELNFLPKFPEPGDVFDKISGGKKMTKKRLSVMLGREASSGYRWITAGGRSSPILGRLLLLLLLALDHKKGGDDSSSILEEWDRMVETEALARGVPNVWATGRWTMKHAAQKAPRKVAVKKMVRRAGT